MSAAGRYKCTTKDDETSCELTVYMKNRFLEPLKNVSLKEGKNALFECKMTDKEAKVVWYHLDERILEGIDDEKYDIKVLGEGRHQLIINSCKVSDIGEVRIFSTNSHIVCISPCPCTSGPLCLPRSKH